jgi:hypothetical protein
MTDSNEDDIEITLEMLEWGVAVLRPLRLPPLDEALWVERVYRTMESCRRFGRYSRAGILHRAETFVRDVVEKDFEQVIDSETVRQIAVKIAATIPTDRVSARVDQQTDRASKQKVSIPRPISEAPRDGTYIILLAPSGYGTTPWRAEIGHYDAVYRPHNPWQNHSNDPFTDGGEEPTHFLPLPAGEPVSG